VFVFLALFSLSMAWILKYTHGEAPQGAAPPTMGATPASGSGQEVARQ